MRCSAGCGVVVAVAVAVAVMVVMVGQPQVLDAIMTSAICQYRSALISSVSASAHESCSLMAITG